METDSNEYKNHLLNKYLPGRRFYLSHVFYPKILQQFCDGEIVDLGCGTGEFLQFFKNRNRKGIGIDNNPYLVKECKLKGYNVILDSVITMENIHSEIKNALCDNVLEHLDIKEIHSFFNRIDQILSENGTLIISVPDKKGYKYDPTHKSFIDFPLINTLSQKYGMRITKYFYHPINLRLLGRILYLNMQVFVIRRKIDFNTEV